MNFKPRKMRIAQMIRQCGVFVTALHLRSRGYTIDQTLAIVSVNLKKRT